jgi:hypothetical protein
LAGAIFGLSESFPILVATGIVGVISTSGGEIGPFMVLMNALFNFSVTSCSHYIVVSVCWFQAVEQSCLTDALLGEHQRLDVDGKQKLAILLGWYDAHTARFTFYLFVHLHTHFSLHTWPGMVWWVIPPRHWGHCHRVSP